MVRKLEWGVANVALPTSVGELDALLDRLSEEARAQPFMVDLFVEDGPSLSIGLGEDVSVANFTSAGGEPPYFQSERREPLTDDEDGLVFYYGGEWSEFPPSRKISIEEARAAMRAFFEHGTRPEVFEWREV